MKRAEKIKLIFSTTFRVLLIVAAVFAAFRGNWMTVATATLTMFLTFLPNLIKNKYRIITPNEFEIVILIFIYASMYLGEMKSFYDKFWWWDLMLHTISGIIIGIIGFALVQILNEEKESLKLSPKFVAIFSFSFAIAIGTIWEIYEFAMDSFFGLQMQKSGLVDTMWDLIVDTTGAALISSLGYIYLKRGYNFFKKYKQEFLKRHA